jgi:hypothetical protein
MCFDGHVGWLDLRQINLSGPIPPELAQLTQIQRLLLSGNRLTGPIPTWLGERTLLTTLDLEGNRLSGAIPPELGNLTAMQYLWLGTNQVSGTIPIEFGRLTALRHVVLWQNPNLVGAVPVSFAQIADALAPGHCLLGKSGLFVYDTPAYRAADVNGDGAVCDLPLLPPPDPSGLIAQIKSKITDLVSAGTLSSAKAKALLNILVDVQKQIDKGHFAEAADILQYDFIPKVQTSMASGLLSAVEGQALIELAQRAIELLRALA